MTLISDTTSHIIIIDDDARILSLTGRFLQKNGFRVSTATSAGQARELMTLFQFDLFIVDVMMPEEDGISFTKSLRGLTQTPVLMLTALSEVDDRIEGLQSGADDYLAKPFDPRELLLRIKNLLKRMPDHEEEILEKLELIKFGEYSYYLNQKLLTQNEENIALTDTEHYALSALSKAFGHVVPREFLSTEGADVSGRAVDVLINRLRKKIEKDPANPRYIQTIRGKGYLLKCDL